MPNYFKTDVSNNFISIFSARSVKRHLGCLLDKILSPNKLLVLFYRKSRI